jgi:hypothetical protein
MLTLTEMETKEREDRERAGRYEDLLSQRNNLQPQVERLSAATIDTAPLVTIGQLAKAVPPNLITRAIMTEGRTLVTGGVDVQSLLQHIVSAALNDLQNQETRRVRNLEDAKRRLGDIEKALATEFTDA